MIKMGMKPKTLLYHKAFFKTLLLFKLKLGILPRVHLTAKLSLQLSLVCYRDFLFFLLDEVEHDIMNYQNRGQCYLPKPKAEADNTDTRF